ncbi:hypothetical protein NQZ68_031170 [Dissostichus eleginoides]|nr:hypothetical protein NQZ68_031170 [Dissostichus eleginoides]
MEADQMENRRYGATVEQNMEMWKHGKLSQCSITIDELLMRLYSLYHRSSKKWKELKAIGEALEEHVMKPSRSHGG